MTSTEPLLAGSSVEEEASLESKLDRIRHHKTSKLPHQKQLATILEAIEQTLKEQKTELTASAYVVSLLSLLGQAFTGPDLTNEDIASASIYLLDSILPHVPLALLRDKSSAILSFLTPLVSHPDVTSGLLRSTMGCLETLLIAQEPSAWSQNDLDSGCRAELRRLLDLSVDDRPKVRKRAQESITTILSHPPGILASHPALSMCAEIAMSATVNQYNLVSEKKKLSPELRSTAEKKTIFALQLIRAILLSESGWPHKKIEALCSVLFTVSRSEKEYLVVTALDVFQAMFATNGDSNHSISHIESINFGGIVKSILDLRPSETDQQLAPPWIAIVSQCYSAYTRIDDVSALEMLPDIFEIIASFLKSELPANVATSAAQGLIALASTCIPTKLLLEKPMAKVTKKALTRISTLSVSLLSVKYRKSWRDVLQLFVALFDTFDSIADQYLISAVETINNLRAVEHFEGIAEIDEVLAAAIRAIGPEKLLELLPLNLDNPGPTTQGRAFLLPLLRDNIKNATLAHFFTEMVPLSQLLAEKSEFSAKNNKDLDAKIYETLVKQIWSLFPRYCDLPTDLRESLNQQNAEKIANVLYENIELRETLCKGLRTLVESHKIYLEDEASMNPVLESKLSREDIKKNLEYLGSIASKFLVVLFNIFNQTASENRLFILDTIGAFLSITPTKDVNGTFQKVASVLKTTLVPSGDVTVSQTMLDLIVTMVPYLPSLLYPELKNIVFASIRNDDYQVQRRTYRIISKLAQAEDGGQYIQANIDAFEKAILNAASAVKPPARNSRLTALIDLVRILPSSDLHLLTVIVPEAVIGTKEINEKTREAAYQLLISMGDKMAGGGSVSMQLVANVEESAPNVEASIEEYFTMVSAGLAGSTPHMISATIAALSHLLFQYKNILRTTVIEELVDTVDLFLTSHNREIVKASLGFLKVTITCLPKEIVQPRLASIVPNIVEWAHEHHSRFKLKVKHLIERLIRRFGASTIEHVFPESDMKLFTNIRKSRERSRRNRANEDGLEDAEHEGHKTHKRKPHMSEYEAALYDSSSEDEADEEPKTRTAEKGRRPPKDRNDTYIINDRGDEPLDLLNNTSLAKMSSVNPRSVKPRNRQSKLAEDIDGKFIVTDDAKLDNDADMISKLAARAEEASSVSAYVEAVKNGPVRGQRNKLKYKNKRGRDDSDEEIEKKQARRRAKF